MEQAVLIKRPKVSTSSVVLITLGVFIAAFIIAMTIIYCVKGSTPDTLIQCVMGGGGFEAFLLAGIRVSKVIAGNKPGESKETEETENG